MKDNMIGTRNMVIERTGARAMWVLHLINFGMCWHFDTYEKALAKGRSTGFEFTIFEFNISRVKEDENA